MKTACLHILNVIFSLSVAMTGFCGGMVKPSAKTDSLFGGDLALAVMSSDLLRARNDIKSGMQPAVAARKHMPQAMRGGKIQVIIGLDKITTSILATIKSAGLETVHIYDKDGLHTVTVRCTDPRQLDSVARMPETRTITTEPAGSTHSGSVTSQGDSSQRASNARANFAVNGTGYRVGVLSDSIFDTRGGNPPGVYPGNHTNSNDQVSGDLPANVWVVDPGPGGGADEGNAMAQIIYDLAPGCNLAFASANSGYYPFASNIASLVNDNVSPSRILVDDWIYYGEPMYQDGPIAIAANSAVTSGVPYFTSAGNFSSNAHEKNYVDKVPGLDDMIMPPSGNDLHDFGVACGLVSDDHLTINMPAGGIIFGELHWDEPYGGGLASGTGSEADLDLYLVNSVAVPNPGNIIASSTSVQGTVGSPFGDAREEIIETVGAGVYHFCIDHFKGRDDTSTIPLKLHLLVKLTGAGASVTDPYIGSRTVYGHAAATNVQAIAAMDYREEQQNGNFVAPGPQLDVESFSSLGGALPIWFPSDGSSRYAVSLTRNKPDLTGIDGVDNTFFGSSDVEPNLFMNFFGTSAAAPHIAAVAALMLDKADNAAQSPTPASIYAIMQNTARDAEGVGWDSLSGSGLVDANAAVGDPGLVPVTLSAFTIE